MQSNGQLREEKKKHPQKTVITVPSRFCSLDIATASNTQARTTKQFDYTKANYPIS